MTQDEIFARLLADVLLEKSKSNASSEYLQTTAKNLAAAWKAGMSEYLTREFCSTQTASSERP